VYNVYDPYIYDAVLAFAYAYESFIDRGLWPQEISLSFTDALHSYLLYNTSFAGKNNFFCPIIKFTGLTGRVRFDENGDREGVYDIVNLKQNGSIFRFTGVGTWSKDTQSNFTDQVIWYDGTTNKPQDGSFL
jgi:hypothetical protein